jgi:hypothetical protein
MTNNPFEDAPVIFVYDDDQAVADGYLVKWEYDASDFIDGRPINRITRAVWEATVEKISFITNITPVRHLIRRLQAEGQVKDAWLTGEVDGVTYWCIPNEIGGYTLMLPDDY